MASCTSQSLCQFFFLLLFSKDVATSLSPTRTRHPTKQKSQETNKAKKKKKKSAERICNLYVWSGSFQERPLEERRRRVIDRICQSNPFPSDRDS